MTFYPKNGENEKKQLPNFKESLKEKFVPV